MASHLFVLPSVPVWSQGDSLVFDRKFYDGMVRYVELWPGPVTCVMELHGSGLANFGLVTKSPADLPFRCITIAPGERFRVSHLEGASIILAAGDAGSHLGIPRLARKVGAKLVYVIEYVPETRYQIAALSTSNPVVRLRRFLYIFNEERRRRAAFRLADGLQSNGAPAGREYARYRNNLVYFDTRVFRDQYIGEGALETRLQTLSEKRPLRLAFSGRLVRMKGADHLLSVARELRSRKVDFLFTIYGTGDLDAELKAAVREAQLDDCVFLPGAVDFYQELLPAMMGKTDLFIVLHRQSDPSCTYLETLSCGVPLLGYDNRALTGILDQADVGWAVPMDDYRAVADVIQSLDQDRGALAEKSKNSLAMARNHDFETTFQNRIDQLRHLVAGPSL